MQRYKRVAIIYKSLPQYRRQFFELLRERLAERGVEFLLIYGQADPIDASKMDRVDLPWAIRIPNRIFRLGGRSIYWQPCLRHLRGVDLVIVEQASKLLVNYVLLLQHILGIRRLAFWGHGKNFQGHTRSSAGEFVKRLISQRVGWWFAYNDTSARVVRELGFPQERITDVQNAIDTHELVDEQQRIAPEEVEQRRASLGITSENACIFAGSMYPEKRVEFLLEACTLIRKDVPDFEMIFLGAGPDADLVSAAAESTTWVHYVGPKFGREKVPYFMMSKLFLLPGLVGLAVLDSFALETPLVTTDVDYHSPEIEYLVDGENGVIVRDPENVEEYARSVAALLRDETRRARLEAGCRAARSRYTIEDMAERFAEGVVRALAA